MSAKAWSRCLERSASGAGLALALALSAARAQSAAPAAAEPAEAVAVGLVVNGSAVADAQLLWRSTDGGERFWLPLADAARWRMSVAGRPRRSFEGTAHAAFCTGRDRCRYDDAGSLLTLTLDSADIVPLRIEPSMPELKVVAGAPFGGYLNYDVSAFKYGKAGVAALTDGHLYSPYGHGVMRIGGVYGDGGGSRTLAQAVWQIDQPERGRSIQIGSIAIPDTALGAGLPLTGVRIGSNLQLDPRLPPTLRPTIEGVVDSAVRTDVFIDGVFRQTTQIPYGRYSIELLPQLSGRGDIELVSTDPSGLQTRLVVPYYQAPSMLTPGADEWSLDAGVLADDGSRRADMASKPLVASASWRRGLGRSLTGQAQVLVAKDAARLAVSADTVAPRWGASSFGLVWQRSSSHPSARVWLGAGHEYVSRQTTFSVRAEQVLGGCSSGRSGSISNDRLARPCQRGSALVGTSFGPRWSASIAADLQRESDGRRSHVAALSGRYQMGPFSQLSLSLQQLRAGDRRATVASLAYSRPLGGRYAVQTGLQQRSDEGLSLQWAVQKTTSADSLPDGPRFQAYGGFGAENSNAGARWADDAGAVSWRSEVRVDSRGLTGAAGLAGAIGYTEGRSFAARRIDDAFVLVDVGVPGLPVLLDNREVARTNTAGWAIVTGARARQENLVGVDATALPIQYAMPRDQISVVPGIRSGALARFDISDGGLAIRVRDENGERLPTGGVVTVSSQTLPTAVTSRSEIFLDRSDRPARVSVEWAGQRCAFDYVPDQVPEGGLRCIAP